MSKTYAFCLLLLSLIIFGQEKTPMQYSIKVTTESGLIDTLDIDNYNKKSNIPPPIVKDKCIREGKSQTGCIYYDGEYSWTGIKDIEIIKIEYFDVNEPPLINNNNGEKKNDIDAYSLKNYGRTESEYQKMFKKLPERATKKIKVYSFKQGKYVVKNVIWFPRQEAINRQKYFDGKGRSIFDEKGENPKNIDEEKKHEEKKIVDWKSLNSKQYVVYETDGIGNFKKIKNTGIKINGENVIIPNDINEDEFEKISIEKGTTEYLDLSKLNLIKGYYIVGKGFDDENKPHFRTIPLKLNHQEE